MYIIETYFHELGFNRIIPVLTNFLHTPLQLVHMYNNIEYFGLGMRNSTFIKFLQIIVLRK